MNVIYYSTFKKYNFKKSKLTLSLSLFEVVYIWQHANCDYAHPYFDLKSTEND